MSDYALQKELKEILRGVTKGTALYQVIELQIAWLDARIKCRGALSMSGGKD